MSRAGSIRGILRAAGSAQAGLAAAAQYLPGGIGGGRAARNNNLFGWMGSCDLRLSPAGIHEVASHLGTSKLYRNKDVDGILRTYTRTRLPRGRQIRMRRISPSEQIMIVTRCYSSNRTTK